MRLVICREGIHLPWAPLSVGRDLQRLCKNKHLSCSPVAFQLILVPFSCQLPEAPPSEEEEQEAWVNALLGRMFWDFLGEKYWSDLVSKKIQMKLSKIKVSFST